MQTKKYDWLGLCVEMMSEYFPEQVHSKSDSKKYWNISEHLLCLMEHSELTCHYSKNKELDRRNDLVKEMIKKLTVSNTNMLQAVEYDADTDIDSNIALNNLLLLSMMNYNRETKKEN
jgi:hypothetical protein